jgi:hypothetical protein
MAPNAAPAPTTKSEKSVAFLNSEVLNPGEQSDISFVKPFYEQTLVMALEDARSFVQGAEQILLVALAKALEKYLSGGAGAVEGAAQEENLTELAAKISGSKLAAEALAARGTNGEGATAPPPNLAPSPDAGLQAIERVMASCAQFHAQIAETAHKYRGDNK